MKTRIALITVLGIALAYYVMRHVGLGAIFAAATSVSWAGFSLLCLWGLLAYCVMGSAWSVLFSGAERPQLWVLVWARMVRDSASEVLPFSQVGGMAVGVRAAILHGVRSPLAVGSMIVDVTIELLAQVAYAGTGILALTLRAPHSPKLASLTLAFWIGLPLAAAAIGGFLALQRYGHHWLADKLAARLFAGSRSFTAGVAAALDDIYSSRLRIGSSLLLHYAAWVTSAGGTWIAFRLIGQPLSFASVLALESLVYAARSAGFAIPNALGVQEAAYVVLAPLVGVGKEFALAVSLLKRARDIAIGIPILLIWQSVEGRRALIRQRTGGAQQ